MGTNDVLGGFKPPPQSPSVLGCEHPMPVFNVSSQEAFYCSSVKVSKILAGDLAFVNSLKEYSSFQTIFHQEGNVVCVADYPKAPLIYCV